MPRSWLFGLLGLVLATAAAPAKDKDKPSKELPAAELPGKAGRDIAPGYKTRLIEGFTILLSKETLENAPNASFERKPLEVLELELKTITRIMPARVLRVLRKCPVWVEWNEQKTMSNGRDGVAVAVYYGGHQLSMLRRGENPLKAKSVVILSMRSLTQEHQPRRDSGRCVILHEIAHAVHFEILGGSSNPQIKAAYKQAMERKLYDPKMYIATNEAEFFAEATCAYFGQLHHYPKKRADLKKHDPISHTLMQRVWGRPRESAADTRTAGTASPSADVKLSLKDLDLGRPVMGPKFTSNDLKRRPVMVLVWNAGSTSSLASFPKMCAWDAELRDFGLATIGLHLTGTQPQDVVGTARSREVTFAVHEGRWITGKLINDFKEFPVCMVFDHEGECVFRGVPFDAEEPIREAVGRALVAATGKETFCKSVTAITEALENGKSPSSLLPRLAPIARTGPADVVAEARLLRDKIAQYGDRVLKETEPLVKSEPLDAFLKLESLPKVYRETPVASRATALLTELRKNRDVQTELRARPTLAFVKKLDTELRSKPGGFEPKAERFQQQNLALLRQLQAYVQSMQKRWPKARATDEAIRIGEKYGVITR